MQYSGTDCPARVRSILTAAALAVTFIIVDAARASPSTFLVGHWNLDEPSGQLALDAGPFGLHGTLGSSGGEDADDPLRVAGIAGGALRFASSAYVRVADGGRLNLQTLAVEAVARAGSSPGAYRYLVAHRSSGCFAGAYGLYTAANGGLAFYVFDGERYFVSASARPQDVWDGRWRGLAGSFDGRTVRAFVDGREVGAGLVTPTGTAIESASMAEGTFFGSYVGACRLPFAGDLDSVRIWSDSGRPAAAAGGAGVIGATGGDSPPAVPLAPGTAARVMAAPPPRSSCRVYASRKQIRAKRRVRVTVRALHAGRPLRRVRLSVRRTNTRAVIAAPRTNAKGSARLTLKISKRGRLRIGVVGRSSCTPAFVRVAHR